MPTTPLVRKLELFVQLSDDDRAALKRIGEYPGQQVEARRDLISEGEPPRMYVVSKGWACLYKWLPDGRRQIVGLLLPGDCNDLRIQLLDTMDYNVGAVTALKAIEIPQAELDDLGSRQPRLADAFTHNELVTNAMQREWALCLGQRSAYERLAHLMVEIYLRLDAVGLASDGEIEWPLTQSDLADALGLTAVHVNRTLQRLRADGLIELAHRRLVIRDLGRLKQAGLFNDNYLHRRGGGKPDSGLQQVA